MHSAEGGEQQGYYPPDESHLQHQQGSGLMGQSSGSFLDPQDRNKSELCLCILCVFYVYFCACVLKCECAHIIVRICWSVFVL
jgi:hypothetical protein